MKMVLAACAALCLVTAAQGGNLDWIDGKDLPIEGRSGGVVECYYDRLPAKLPAAINGNVQALLHHTSGEQFRFTTTSPVLFFRWSPYYDVSVKRLPGCAYGSLGMAHMPATGVSGIDVYAQAKNGIWEHRYTGFIYPGEAGCVSTGRLDNVYIEPGTPICVNLPLYNGLKSFQLGVLPGSKVSPLPPRRSGVTKPVVFYGTSITQGGCASRPGLGFVNIIGRELDVPVVNLGFSGGGRMELAMSDELARIDASCYVLDCLGNMKDRIVETNYEPFVRRLRALKPGVPIVLAEQSDVKGGPPNAKDLVARAVYEKLVGEGWTDLVYLPKKNMFRGSEGTVDGCHPNDLGMRMLADAFGEAVAEALKLPPKDRHAEAEGFGVRVLAPTTERPNRTESPARQNHPLKRQLNWYCRKVGDGLHAEPYRRRSRRQA